MTNMNLSMSKIDIDDIWLPVSQTITEMLKITLTSQVYIAQHPQKYMKYNFNKRKASLKSYK